VSRAAARLALLSVGAALVAVALPPLGSMPASATHPCGMNSDGTTFDSDPTADHAACPGPRPAPRPGDVQLTDADSGKTVTVTPGTRVYVDLHPPSGQIWSDVNAGGSFHRDYLDVQSGISSAVFTAEGTTDGQQIQAQTDIACAHSEPRCLPPSQQWSVTVVVSGAASPAPSPSPSAEPCTPAPRPVTNATVLTEASDRTTVQVPRGQPLLVSFAGCSGLDLVAPDGGGPLYRYRVRASNPGGVTAVYRAMALGTTTVSSHSDPPCSHATNPCPTAFRSWTVTVQVVEPCALTGPADVPSGSNVPLAGTAAAGASVQIWFRQRGATDFVVRRTVTAGSDGTFTAQYAGNDDYRWYATSGDCTTPPGLTQVTSWLIGPRYATRGSVVPISAHGPAGASVALYFRPPGGGFSLGRTGRLDRTGSFRASYVAMTDQRYYAVTGPGR
jgi:hypothetical protein